MGQADCLELLKKKRKWMNAAEISEILGINKSSLNDNLRKLYHQGELERKERKLNTRITAYFYRIKNGKTNNLQKRSF